MKPNPTLENYYATSADFRILYQHDPLLKACFEAGYDPLKTIIAMADRAEKMRSEMQKIYETAYLPKGNYA